ncbi:hypothetical protein [Citrobacter freundii]|nr:hypothetical protein [Citrobacter freundii]EGH9355040.1 hypothetical protein [Salmonella enterica subsp. enterica serovar Schwarzengrund]MBJ8704999.1 hypothetical protein [Citrobacter freundii]MCX3158436.1 hypothetical protein [Citrobacter freundii]MCX3163213.1 hypothetical protein [Citrobacter freundii]MDH2706856.1 hypothetical protein [Citrobacter freundii]
MRSWLDHQQQKLSHDTEPLTHGVECKYRRGCSWLVASATPEDTYHRA